jgi:DNA-directed RNA polymerase sigma subunit (sigma70/sigma32)
VSIDDDKATVTGEASDLATKEKVVLVVGNTEGIASVEDNMTVAEVEEIEVAAMAQFHSVVSGDTLGKIAKEILIKKSLKLILSIAKKYNGNGLSFEDLIAEGILGLMKGIQKFLQQSNLQRINRFHYTFLQLIE